MEISANLESLLHKCSSCWGRTSRSGYNRLWKNHIDVVYTAYGMSVQFNFEDTLYIWYTTLTGVVSLQKKPVVIEELDKGRMDKKRWDTGIKQESSVWLPRCYLELLVTIQFIDWTSAHQPITQEQARTWSLNQHPADAVTVGHSSHTVDVGFSHYTAGKRLKCEALVCSTHTKLCLKNTQRVNRGFATEECSFSKIYFPFLKTFSANDSARQLSVAVS